MKKWIYLISCLLIAGLASTQAQTVVEVGDDLIQIITEAADGAEIVIKPGVHVANSTEIPVANKSLTIRAEEGGEKPLVYIQEFGLSGTVNYLTIEGLEISGASYDTLTAAEDTALLAGDYLLNVTDSFTTGGDLIVRDCIMRNFTRCVIRADRAENTIEKIEVDDCVIFDLRGGSSYGPFRLKSKVLFDELNITNSTFHHIQGTFIDCKDMVSHAATINIDHVTLYDWGGVIDVKYLFEIVANDLASLVITNSILGKTNDAATAVYGFRIMEEAYCEMGFSVMTPDFVVDDSAYADVLWDKDEFNEADYEVPFIHPDTSNFGIPYPNDLYEFSSEGTLVGDPRWSNEPHIEAVEEILGSAEISAFPNPAHQTLHILNGGTGKMEMFDMLGVKVAERDLVNSSLYQMNIADLSPGFYFIRMNNSEAIRIIIK